MICTSCGDDEATICLDCAELDPNPAYYPARPERGAIPQLAATLLDALRVEWRLLVRRWWR